MHLAYRKREDLARAKAISRMKIGSVNIFGKVCLVVEGSQNE